MRTKHKTTLFKRLGAWVLTLALVVGLLPQTAFAAGTDTGKAIQFVDSGTAANISGAQADNIYFGTYQQSSDGNSGYNIDPIKWRVLENADGQLFLLSDQNLDVFQYHTDYESVTWETSTMRSWLNGYDASHNTGGDSGIDYTSDNFIGTAFSAKEQAAIADTEVFNDDNPTNGTEGGNNTTDQIFLLSIAEAQNSSYFADNSSRIATNTAYVAGGGKLGSSYMNGVDEADYWWLRSPGGDAFYAAHVYGLGGVGSFGNGVSLDGDAVRPAFNLDLTSVLFTSAAAGGKSATGMDRGLTAVDDYTGSEWKLTLLDETRNSFEISNATITDTITFSYSGAATGTNEYISAVVVDNGAITHYGRILQPGSTSGTASFTIPDGVTLSDTVKLYVFNEQYNSDKMTDYASQLKEISSSTDDTTDPTLSNGSATRDSETTATVKFTSSEAGSYYYEVVNSGENQPTIDTDGTGTTCGTTEQTISLTNLSDTSAKDIYIVVKDAAGNVSQPLTIQIPAYTSTTFTVTVNVDPSDGGTASANYTTAAPNTEITLTATPSTGYHFKEWQVTEGTASIGDDNKFTMPAENVTVKAVFEAHSFTQENTDSEYLASSATCTQAATYYYSCSCGAKDTNNTFTSGEALGHTWSNWTSSGNDEHTHTCSVCQASETESCSGGEATCTNKAVCSTCNTEYGEVNPDNHTGQPSWVQNADTHKKVYSCCNAEISEAENHSWENGVCTVCQYPCTHTGGEATCMSKAVCTICNSQYGELDPDNHNPASEWTQEDGKHYHICQNGCGTHLDEANCDGGTATCISKANCSVCGHEYGGYGAHVLTAHDYKAPTCTETGNSQYWECSVCKQLFSDAQGNTETTIADVTLAVTEHTAGETWQHDNGSTHWKLCVNCSAKVDEAAHDYENGVCKVCNAVQPTYAISASPETLDFGSETEGYADAPAAQTVTLTNTGNQNVTVDLPTSTNYIITSGEGFTNDTATLAPNGTAAFTVQPKTGLGAGDYSETLTISGSNNTSASVALSFEVDVKLYSVTVNGSYAQTTGAGSYAEGATVAIDAGTRSGYTFDGWTGSDGVTFANAGSAQTSFTMPGKSVTVTASWVPNSSEVGDQKFVRYIVEHYKQNADGSYRLEDAEYPIGEVGNTVTATARNYEGYTYNEEKSNASGTLTEIKSDADIVTLKLYYDLTVFTVTVETSGNGTASASPASATMGQTVTLTANAASGYHFVKWEIVSGGIVLNGNTFTMPAGNVTVKAVFAEHTYGDWAQNSNDTHTRTCTACGVSQTENCSGGTATCTAQAVCAVCGRAYGEQDPDNHSKLTGIKAVPATHLTTGNIAYWHCEGCGKYYADALAAQEITLADTVLEKLPGHTADGSGWHRDENGHWQLCACGEHLDAAAHTFAWVTDKPATAAEAGSRHEQCTVCGYRKAAESTPPLAPEPDRGTDEHPEIGDAIADGTWGKTESAPADGETNTEKTVPATGDSSQPVLWIGLLAASGLGIAALLVLRRRKRQ